MKIFLQRPSGEDAVEIEVDAHSSMSDLERAIQDLDVSSENAFVSLLLGERILKDTAAQRSLADHGVTDGCVLTLVRHAVPNVLTACGDKTAKLWNGTTGECTQTLIGHEQCLTSAVFSADGSSVLTASRDKTAKRWNSITGECSQTFSGHRDNLYSAVFSH